MMIDSARRARPLSLGLSALAIAAVFCCVALADRLRTMESYYARLLHACVLLMLPVLVLAVCPHCSGNADGCTFGSDGRCPAGEGIAFNAALLAGIAMAGVGTKVLSFLGLIKPRFLRAFPPAALNVISSLAKKPEKGVAFVHTINTKDAEVKQAISTGQYSFEAASFRYSELADSLDPDNEGDAKLLKKIDRSLASLKFHKETALHISSSNSTDLSGSRTYILARASTWVMEEGLRCKVCMTNGSDISSASTSLFTSKLQRPTTFEECSEILNLNMLFSAVLGVCAATVTAQFYEYVIYDTIRAQGKPWQVAFELLVILYARIEDSGGSLTVESVYNEACLNSVLDEACRNALHYYPNVSGFFRPPGGNPGANGGINPNDASTTVKYNGKGSDKGRPCGTWNRGEEHKPEELRADGTCKRMHVCNKWISSAGPYGRCLGPHIALRCTHADKCDEPVKK